jgi:hypothetical protein
MLDLGSQPCAALLHVLQEILGLQLLHGPVLDLELLNSSMSSQEPFMLFPIHVHSSRPKASMCRQEFSTGAGRTRSSRRHGSRQRTQQQQQLPVLPSQPKDDEELLMSVANSLQQANKLQRSTDSLCSAAVADVAWLLVSKHTSACRVWTAEYD